MDDISLQEYFTLATILDQEKDGPEDRVTALTRIIRGLKAYQDQARADGTPDET